MSNILDIAKEGKFYFSVDWQSECVKESVRLKGFLFEYCVDYEINHYNFIPEDYDHEEEAESHITVTGVSEVYIFDSKGKEIELTGKEVDDLTDLIFSKLLNN